MNCNCEKEYIYIYKGDDTNWNGEQFLTVNITSESVDLSTMTAKFILGGFTQTYSLTTGSFQVDLTHAVTGTYSYGPIDGIIQVLDNQGRIKTVSNTIPFYITNKVIPAQDATYQAEVAENSPIEISVDIGFGDVAWGKITGNINDQLDLKAALYSKVSKVGDTMTGDLVMDNAAVDFGDFKVEAENGKAKIEGTQYGLRVDTTNGLGAVLLTTRGTGNVLTTLDTKHTYNPNSLDPISGKGVAQAISTKQDTLTTAQLTAVNSGIDSAKVAQIAMNTQAISNEVLARQSADNGLQTQIDALSAASDVKDIVGTYAELQAYDTSHLGNNDIIKVLTDETHDGAPSYYRWNKQTETFTYIGSESASYTKGEADAKFETITGAAQTYATKSELTTGLATKASTADGTTIVDNGSTISTVAVKEQNNALAIKEWVGTKAQYEAIATKDPNTLYTITDDPDTQTIVVDSALSSTSENPVQNKAIYNALQDLDALPSQTGHAGEYLTTDGTTASWGAVAGGGIQNESTNTGAIAIGGYNTTVGTNKGTQHSVIIGQSAQGRESSTSYPAVVIGYSATGNNGSVAVGRSANANKTSATYNTAVGARTDADNNGVAIGHYANAYTNAVAIGGSSSSSDKTYANGDGAIAIGSKAVANSAGTIQIGTGTNSTAGTVQIGSYPILDANGIIPAERLPLVGGENITITSAADYVISNMTTTAYATLNSSITFANSTFSIVTHIKTASSFVYGAFLSPVNKSYPMVELGITNAGKIRFQESSSASAVIFSLDSATTLDTNSEYWIKAEYNGSSYNIYIGHTKADLNGSPSDTYTGTGGNIVQNSYALGSYRTWTNKNTFNGSIWVSDTKVISNNITVFDGSDQTQFSIVGSPTVETSQDIKKINFDFTSIYGYDGTQTQVLKNINGILTWVNE